MDIRKTVGNEGEQAACDFLALQGHTILSRNWRAGHLELDIVSLDPAGVHFVEVKTRRPPVQLAPQEAVNYTKQQRLVRAAKAWLSRQKPGFLKDVECHFDVVSVIFGKEERKIEYFPDAFYPVYC